MWIYFSSKKIKAFYAEGTRSYLLFQIHFVAGFIIRIKHTVYVGGKSASEKINRPKSEGWNAGHYKFVSAFSIEGEEAEGSKTNLYRTDNRHAKR